MSRLPWFKPAVLSLFLFARTLQARTAAARASAALPTAARRTHQMVPQSSTTQVGCAGNCLSHTITVRLQQGKDEGMWGNGKMH